jgi:hypothetical protein
MSGQLHSPAAFTSRKLLPVASVLELVWTNVKKRIKFRTSFWRGTVLLAGRSRLRFAMSLFFFNLPNPTSRTMTLGSTQPLIEKSTRYLPGGWG